MSEPIAGRPIVTKGRNTISIIAVRGGIMVSFDLDERNARAFAKDILEEVEKLPRMACEEDLGIYEVPKPAPVLEPF